MKREVDAILEQGRAEIRRSLRLRRASERVREAVRGSVSGKSARHASASRPVAARTSSADAHRCGEEQQGDCRRVGNFLQNGGHPPRQPHEQARRPRNRLGRSGSNSPRTGVAPDPHATGATENYTAAPFMCVWRCGNSTP